MSGPAVGTRRTGSPRSSDRDLDRPRLLIVADSLEGGLGAVARAHASWFRAAGWTVRLAAPAPERRDDDDPDRVELPLPGTVRRIGAMAGAARAVRTLRSTFSPDVVHCHGARAGLATVTAGLRPFVTLHGAGTVPDDPVGYGRVRATGLRLLPRLLAGAFSAAPGVPGWQFLPHASPRLGDLDLLPFPEPASTPTVLWVGRLDEGKHPEVLVQAVAALAAERPVRCLILGTGPTADAVTALVEELNAPVELLGHGDPREWLAECWALALFSDHEAVSFVVQEAMWVGRVVVATPLPGVAWLMGDVGVPVRTVDEAVDAFRRLCDHGTAARLGAASAARARAVLDPQNPWPAVAAAYGLDPGNGVGRYRARPC